MAHTRGDALVLGPLPTRQRTALRDHRVALQASVEQLRGLPPALVVNGEHDVLRDEGEAYARKLSQAGVPVTQVRYGGTIHDFVLLNPITATPAPRAAIAQAANYLHAALGS